MCGRFTLAGDIDFYADYFGVERVVAEAIEPSWNVAPTDRVYTVAERDGERLAFAYLIRDNKKTSGPAGLRARDALLARFAKWGKGEFAWAQQPRAVIGPEQNG